MIIDASDSLAGIERTDITYSPALHTNLRKA
jgi:hypothetical protein